MQSYKAGILLVGGALFVGYLGATFWDDFLSSALWLTYGFVGIVTAIGLIGAGVIGRTFFMRHQPFKRT